MYNLCQRVQVSICEQGIDASHLRALAALTQLKALNLSQLHWTEDAVEMGLWWLAARLPRLRVLHAPTDVLVRHVISLQLCSPSKVCRDQQAV